MECLRVVERLSAYMDGLLDEHTLEMVEAHLAGCAECRRELVEMRVLVTTVGEIEARMPPAGLRQRIMSSVREARDGERRCARVGELLSAYVDGELPPSQELTVSAHIAECGECAAEIKVIRALVDAASYVTQVEPPAGLRRRIVVAVENKRRRSFVPAFAGWLRPTRTLRTARMAGLAAAAGVVALAVLTNLTQAPQPPRVNAKSAMRAPSVTPIVSVTTTPTQVLSSGKQEHNRVAGSLQHVGRVHRPWAKIAAVAPAATASVKVKPVVPRNARVAVVMPEPIETETVAAEPKPIDVAVAPVTVANVKIETPERPKPAPEVRVAAAPAVLAHSGKDWLRQVKAEAALKRNDGRSGVSIICSRF